MVDQDDLLVDYDDENAKKNEETKHPLPGANAQVKQ
jgi:hypothetical protein